MVQGSMTHTAMYVGDGKIVDIRLGEGVKLKSMAKAMRGKSYIALRPNVSLRKRKKAAAFAKRQVGKDYDDVALMWTGLRKVIPERVVGLIDRGDLSPPKNAKAYTCSNLVVAAYKKSGVNLGNMRSAPVDLRVHPKLNVVTKRLKKGFVETVPWLRRTGSKVRHRQEYRDREQR